MHFNFTLILQKKMDVEGVHCGIYLYTKQIRNSFFRDEIFRLKIDYVKNPGSLS